LVATDVTFAAVMILNDWYPILATLRRPCCIRCDSTYTELFLRFVCYAAIHISLSYNHIAVETTTSFITIYHPSEKQSLDAADLTFLEVIILME